MEGTRTLRGGRRLCRYRDSLRKANDHQLIPFLGLAQKTYAVNRTDCTSTDGLIASTTKARRGPRYKPLSGAPFERRRSDESLAGGITELTHCRSDLFNASSISRLTKKGYDSNRARYAGTSSLAGEGLT